ncbi:uncharacterized protein MELLADRAFT_104264 [Melampsora larici-populina 98AG31]|uniref:Uncharacterized protein n=1 Tax=Melampsora larici-populina (strain 98AG31 / pathotype 3-4-7) TaxID=747676 RepID=F4RE53_MELLP|nr:uncharacterized protein MELLADRAFT_104264 [Melampsora larici-populina 98AG31]EGG09030.1 hypothetical protein MELLADRAFT_104264 [Melampsora larici-populina 98AG31]
MTSWMIEQSGCIASLILITVTGLEDYKEHSLHHWGMAVWKFGSNISSQSKRQDPPYKSKTEQMLQNEKTIHENKKMQKYSPFKTSTLTVCGVMKLEVDEA